MRKMNSICSHASVVKRQLHNFFVHMLLGAWLLTSNAPVVAYQELVTTHEMLPRLVHATSWSDVELLLEQIVTSFTDAHTQADCPYMVCKALATDCLEYEKFLKFLMVHTTTQTCLCVPSAEQPAVRKKGYAYAVAWAKQQKSAAFFNFYACYWHLYAMLFVYTIADLQVASDAVDRKNLLLMAQDYLKKLEKSFFYLETSVYDRPYARLLNGYKMVLEQTKQQRVL